MRKHKIIDSIFFYDEIEMLYFRLTELDEYVDEFIIIESDVDFKGNSKPLNYMVNIELFKKWENKITYLPFSEVTYEDIKPLYEIMEFPKNFNKENPTNINKDDIRFFQLTTLIGLLLKKPLTFDDLILISDVDEIPDLSKVSEFKPFLKFGMIVLKQKNFIWSVKYCDVIPNMGTVGFKFTNLITDPESLYRAYFNKSAKTNYDFEIVENGYHLSHFYDLNKTIIKKQLLHDNTSNCEYDEIPGKLKYSYDNLTSIQTDKNEKNYNLIEYYGDLPKNINLIKNQNIGREWDKKNLLIFNYNDLSDFHQIETNLDSVSIINFTDDPKLPYETELSEKTTLFNILKPRQIFYEIPNIENLEDFQKVFCINDTKKIIQSFLPLNQDLITFLNSESPDNVITLSWKDIRNTFIYDLIKDIV